MNGYTFFVDDGVSEVQVTPAIATLTFVFEPDRDFGYYRLSIAEDMPFTGDDYTFLKGLYDAGCGTYDFIVKYLGNEVYRGLIILPAGVSVNLRDCIITAKIEPQDAYTCLVREWGEQFNILSGTVKRTTETLLGDIAEETCTVDIVDDDILVAIAAGAPDGCLSAPAGAWAKKSWVIEQVFASPVTWRSTAVWWREEAAFPCDGLDPAPPPGGGWLLADDRCAGDGEADWARTPATVLDVFVNDGTRYEERYILAGGTAGGYRNGVLLNDVLTVFAPCGLSVVSDFFGIDPDGTHPANGAYDAALANLQSVVVFQKSDVRKPAASTPATAGFWDYRRLLLSLKARYDVEPRIVGGALRLEHSTYWSAAPGLDLTAGQEAQLVRAALRYEYDTEGLAKAERWSFMEAVSPGFAGRPIEYADCVPQDAQDEITYQIERGNDDISYITANPDQASDDGFCFAATALVGGTYYILSEATIPSFQAISLNGHHSIGRLLQNYHRWNRLLPTGQLNGSPVTFESAVPRRAQDQFTIIYNRALFHSAFTPDSYVVTELGNGEIAQAQYEAYSCAFTFSLKYQ